VPGQSELPGLVVAAALAPGHAERACVHSIDAMRVERAVSAAWSLGIASILEDMRSRAVGDAMLVCCGGNPTLSYEDEATSD
jgi:hypothetical protein